jgi:fused signal recognition particle receptor
MFSFFKRKKKTSEPVEKPVEPVLETRQPETLEEGAALMPVPEHTIAPEPVETEQADQDIPPAQEPPSKEPPVQEPPAHETAAPASTELPPVPAAVSAAPAAAATPSTSTLPPQAQRTVQSAPSSPPVHVDLTEKAATLKKPMDAVLSPSAGQASGAAAKTAVHGEQRNVPAAAPTPDVSAVPAQAEARPAPAAPVISATPDATATVEQAPAASSTAQRPKSDRKSWLARLKDGLSRTGSNISSLFVGVKVDENLFEELETALIMADAGMEATESLLGKLRNKVKKERIEDAQTVKHALRDLLAEHLAPLQKPFDAGTGQTRVVMIAGVNGAGKTTSIGKLAHHFQAQGHSVLLAAGDTFRAAAREQLIEWGSRNNVAVIAQDGGDPAAVAFDAVNAGRARKASIVMIDTAGRLPTQLHLMEELKKIKRVIGKADGDAPHEILLVVDGNTGQNAISQIKAFDAALTLTGLVVTKLDGTAKGGTLAAVAAGSQGVRPVPVYWIGVGESLQDLQPFVASEFAGALLGD